MSTASNSQPEGPTMARTSPTILIVDDDTSVRKVAKIRLEREGYRVISAADGDEGLQLAQTEHPQLILLDILMPRMDGREMLRRLKSDPVTHAIPVILLTVLDAQDELHQSIGPGYADRLPKPYNPDHLLQKVRTLLASPTPERPAGGA